VGWGLAWIQAKHGVAPCREKLLPPGICAAVTAPCNVSSPTPLPKQGLLQQAAHDLAHHCWHCQLFIHSSCLPSWTQLLGST